MQVTEPKFPDRNTAVLVVTALLTWFSRWLMGSWNGICTIKGKKEMRRKEERRIRPTVFGTKPHQPGKEGVTCTCDHRTPHSAGRGIPGCKAVGYQNPSWG